MDSTGIAVINKVKDKNYNTYIEKDLLESPGFFNLKSTETLFNLNRLFLVQGHCRAATLGGVTIENAHPIREDHIIGCHNGTIWLYGPHKKDLDKMSDSRELFRRIATKGIDEAIDGAGTTGAMAITFFNLKNNTFNMFRNKERPLWVMEEKHGDAIYWASELCMLEFLISRTNHPFNDPEILPVDMLFTYNFEELKPQNSREIRPKRVVFKTKGKYNNRWIKEPNDSVAPWAEHNENKMGPGVLCPTCKLFKTFCNCQFVPIIGAPKPKGKRTKTEYKGYMNRTMACEEAALLLRHGCQACTGNSFNVASNVWWIGPTDFLCEDCVETDLIKETIRTTRYKGELVKTDKLLN
jgi:hypothetical protein